MSPATGHLTAWHEGGSDRERRERRDIARRADLTSERFVLDGGLGTLSSKQHFLGMDSDADGKPHGLVSLSESFWDRSCDEGCVVQRIDIESRKVEAESAHVLDTDEVVVVRHDSASSRLLVGYRLPEASPQIFREFT